MPHLASLVDLVRAFDIDERSGPWCDYWFNALSALATPWLFDPEDLRPGGAATLKRRTAPGGVHWLRNPAYAGMTPLVVRTALEPRWVSSAADAARRALGPAPQIIRELEALGGASHGVPGCRSGPLSKT